MSNMSEEVFRAAQTGNLAALKGLIERGGDANSRHPLIGWTATQQAAYGGHTDVLVFLVEHGADVNATDAMGQTALRHAALRGDLQAVQCLVEHGANVNAATSRGVTPLAAAESGGHKTVADYLRSRGAK